MRRWARNMQQSRRNWRTSRLRSETSKCGNVAGPGPTSVHSELYYDTQRCWGARRWRAARTVHLLLINQACILYSSQWFSDRANNVEECANFNKVAKRVS